MQVERGFVSRTIGLKQKARSFCLGSNLVEPGPPQNGYVISVYKAASRRKHRF